jgi:hypothetical protein
MNNSSKANRQYKASVFSKLFGEPEKALEAFNAVSGAQFPPGTQVTMETLDDVLFMDMVNDLAFMIGSLLIVLIEHQSSLSKNLPLRLLMYVARVYEKIVQNDLLYRSALVPIPAPQFIVLYNGEQDLPNGEDKMTLKLSDAFEKLPELKGKLPLELEVTVYNINEGHNEDILAKSETLNGYATFIATVRKYLTQKQPLEDAIRNAVTDCINAGVLAEFLEQHSTEVLNMLTQEWNTQTYGEVRYSEGIQEGMELGEKRGMELGVTTERLNFARRLLAAKMPLEQIASYTLLPLDRLRELSKSNAADVTENKARR